MTIPESQASTTDETGADRLHGGRSGDAFVYDAFISYSRANLDAADKIEAPLLVAQGYNDPRVNHAEAEQIVEALKAKGSPVEYLVKMDEGHGFQNPENRMEFYEKMEAFLKSHLQ